MDSRSHLRLRTLSVILIFSFCLRCDSSPVCSRNAQCDDGDPETYDFCWTAVSQCVNVANSADQSRQYIPTTLQEVIKESNADPLSIAEKRTIISTAAKVMAEFNPHLFLQRNLLQVDIVSELNSYSDLLQSPPLQNQTNFEFHEDMKQIFQKMDDRHTVYYPPVQAGIILGFRVEEYFELGEVDDMGKPRARFVVADVIPGLAPKSPGFEVGVEILRWDGEDIAKVVRKLGEDGYGSNEAAQMSLAVTALAFRFADEDNVPLAKTVKVQYRGRNGNISTAQARWFFIKENQEMGMAASRFAVRRKRRSWQNAPPNLDLSNVEHDTSLSSSSSVRCGDKKVTSVAVKQEFEKLFAAEVIETDAIGEIGRIILPSFAITPTKKLVKELVRVLRLMPESGLILDARNNLGGSPAYAGVLSMLASGKTLDPIFTIMRATNLTFDLATNASKSSSEVVRELVAPLVPALETALQVGEKFTGPLFGFIFEDPSIILRRFPRAYFGPILSVVNGQTYSAGDYFTAIQVDKNISTLVGTSDNVGAGGASTISYSNFANFSADLPNLPGGVEFLTAAQRFYRSGPNAGAMIENFGVKPQIRYYPTLKDAVEGDCDLFEFLGRRLAAK